MIYIREINGYFLAFKKFADQIMPGNWTERNTFPFSSTQN